MGRVEPEVKCGCVMNSGTSITCCPPIYHQVTKFGQIADFSLDRVTFHNLELIERNSVGEPGVVSPMPLFTAYLQKDGNRSFGRLAYFR